MRDAIGDQHFLGLLDLYRGSALSIVIDVSASMSQELDAVKAEARLIVENTHPEVYVLLPYGDPGEVQSCKMCPLLNGTSVCMFSFY